MCIVPRLFPLFMALPALVTRQSKVHSLYFLATKELSNFATITLETDHHDTVNFACRYGPFHSSLTSPPDGEILRLRGTSHVVASDIEVIIRIWLKRAAASHRSLLLGRLSISKVILRETSSSSWLRPMDSRSASIHPERRYTTIDSIKRHQLKKRFEVKTRLGTNKRRGVKRDSVRKTSRAGGSNVE